ncbi:MAG TPA: histidine--tRNA ligase [Polyangia bacterium]|jgi:histidyl-tRNA synthetase|nr:histidine--tRNA ligase [Polyangia bacterium]
MAKKFETPKGTRDYLPSDMRTRRAVFDRLRHYFELYGFEELDTPAFEYLEVLTLKSGPAAENEIYSFVDKGERKLGLRFDLTSSTGRVAASYSEIPRPFYRYQIGKVWRYDRPAAGRYREFYQADADIIGSYSSDCEVDLLLMATEVLKGFELPEYKLAINNRKILEAQVRAAGIPVDKKADALRALDKLLKIGKDGMREEFLRYGLSVEQFDAFYATIVVETLDDAEARLRGDAAGEKGVGELREIFDKAARLGFADRLKFDWSLVRGLDYYTGPIFELQAKSEAGFGSFGGGGRYDDLVGLYGGQAQGAVGLSFGVERLIGLINERGGATDATAPPVLVAPVDDAQFEAAERVALALRRAGVATRVLPAMKRDKIFKYSTAAGLPKLVLVGDEAGVYALREKGGEERKLDEGALVAALTRSR